MRKWWAAFASAAAAEVVHKVKSQWMLKITAYAQRLIDDLEQVNYIDRVKTSQINWIGRSTGAEVDFATTAGDILDDLYYSSGYLIRRYLYGYFAGTSLY